MSTSLPPEPKKKWPAKVRIRRVADGVVRVYECEEYEWEDGFNAVYQWGEGNYGCDCNRASFFEEAGNEDWTEKTQRPCGHTAYVVEEVRIVETGEVVYSDSWRD